MEQHGSSSRDGISGFRSLRRRKVFALCIRIQHFGRNCQHWKWLYMDPDSLVSEPKFLELMINIFANTLKSLTTSREVTSLSLMLVYENKHELVLGNTFSAVPGAKSPNKEVPPEVQCNVFEGAKGEVALTAAGGLRQLLGLTETYENAALVCVHYDGKFYEFVPWNVVVRWEMSPWGYWYMTAENETHMVELEARTNEAGTPLRAPTSEAGLATACKDSCYGELKLQIWERRYDGSKGKVIMEAKSSMAAVEIGGGPWFGTWKGDTKNTPELLKLSLQVPLDLESVFGWVPFFKPPGL